VSQSERNGPERKRRESERCVLFGLVEPQGVGVGLDDGLEDVLVVRVETVDARLVAVLAASAVVGRVGTELEQQGKVALQERVADLDAQDRHMVVRHLVERDRLVPEVVATVLERLRL
jgi:hypothetical protein